MLILATQSTKNVSVTESTSIVMNLYFQSTIAIKINKESMFIVEIGASFSVIICWSMVPIQGKNWHFCSKSIAIESHCSFVSFGKYNGYIRFHLTSYTFPYYISNRPFTHPVVICNIAFSWGQVSKKKITFVVTNNLKYTSIIDFILCD